MPPHISILTPVKNAEKYLQQCLDSILVQSHEDFELILVNDHSTDRSLEIMQYYALQDARVHVHNNTGNGIIDALRLAFSESQGQYITRMDADDKMHPQKLELMSAKLKEKGRGALAVGLVEYFSAAGIGDGYKRYSQWLNALTSTETNFTDIYRECVIPSPCWMIDREDLIACEAFQPNRYPEDYDLCFRFYKNNIKVLGIQTVMHYWRDYPERSSRTDPNYLDNRFFDIKLHYFLTLEMKPETKLVILGAGKKAKYIAKALREKNMRFDWYTNNTKKIGQEVYGIALQNQASFLNQNKPVSAENADHKTIIAISNPQEQAALESLLKANGNTLGKEYFFFC